jgi:hypothetical protein
MFPMHEVGFRTSISTDETILFGLAAAASDPDPDIRHVRRVALFFFFSLSNDDGDEVARHTVPTCIFLLC